MGKKTKAKEKESYIFDKDLAKKAVRLVIPSIKVAMKFNDFKRGCLSICVLDLGGSVLHTENIKDEEWTHDFEKIALSKAKVSFRTKTDSALVTERKPWYHKEEDTIYTGGVYYKGLTVGVSGIEPWFDEMIANWIIFAISGLCKGEKEKYKEKMKTENLDFLPKK